MLDSCVDLARIRENQLSIITFNYDRSIEQYLFDCILHTFRCKAEEAHETLSSIQIVHVYGQLAKLGSGVDERPYSTNITPEIVRLAADGIRVIDERDDQDPCFDRAETLLRQAERISFLGFSYDTTNVARIRVSRVIGDFGFKGTVSGTTVGLSQHETDQATMKMSAIKWHNSFKPLPCLKLLRDRGVLV